MNGIRRCSAPDQLLSGPTCQWRKNESRPHHFAEENKSEEAGIFLKGHCARGSGLSLLGGAEWRWEGRRRRDCQVRCHHGGSRSPQHHIAGRCGSPRLCHFSSLTPGRWDPADRYAVWPDVPAVWSFLKRDTDGSYHQQSKASRDRIKACPIVGPVSASLINIPCTGLQQRNHFQALAPALPLSNQHFLVLDNSSSRVPRHAGWAIPKGPPVHFIPVCCVRGWLLEGGGQLLAGGEVLPRPAP